MTAKHDALTPLTLRTCKGTAEQECFTAETGIYGNHRKALTSRIGGQLRIDFKARVKKIQTISECAHADPVMTPVAGKHRRVWKFEMPREPVFRYGGLAECAFSGSAVQYASPGRYAYVKAIYGFNLQGRTTRFRCAGTPATLVDNGSSIAMESNDYGDVLFARGSGDKALTGGPSPDVICGARGDDKIKGRGGNDTLLGHKGDDAIFGDGGNDRLRGGPGRDRLRGGPGRDVCIGGTGRDVAAPSCEVVRSARRAG